MSKKISFEIPKQYQNFLDTFPKGVKSDIPHEMLEPIPTGIIENIYSKFFFSFLPYDSKDIEQTNNMLIEHLQKYRFLTFHFFSFNDQNKSTPQIVNVVACTEEHVIIIDQIKRDSFETIIKKRFNKDYIQYDLLSNNIEEEKEEQKEVNKFFELINNEMNEFIKYTIPSILGYLIRRHFYPNYYFQNDDFFDFYPTDNNEKNIKTEIIEFLYLEGINAIDEIIEKFKDIKEDIQNPDDYAIKKESFSQSDFIKLKEIHKCSYANFYMVIHIKSLNVLMMKEFINQEENESSIKHEIDFCENYAQHRCMTPFYGFIKEDNKPTGLLYKYLCNGTLQNFCNRNNKDIYILMALSRIIQAINYLHKNSLIHRDIKPENILLDNNFYPYLSDFDTIRKINEEERINEEKTMTQSIGAPRYSSPEQDTEKVISFPTDIYSFGLIIFYLYEKNDMWGPSMFPKKIDENRKKMTNAPNNMNIIYENTVLSSPDKRLKIPKIKKLLCKEIKLIDNEKIDGCKYFDMAQFIYEYILIKSNNNLDDIFTKKLFSLSGTEKSVIYLLLGACYADGICVRANHKKAKNYYEMSSENNNSAASYGLGDMYFNGLGVEKDESMAKKKFELSIEQGCSYGYVGLGDFYLASGNYSKAKELYEISSQSNNENAYLNLGMIYENALGVKQDYHLAKLNYEKSAELNNSEALFRLGVFYYLGKGVEKDLNLSEKYFELATALLNVDAFNILANCFYIPKNNMEKLQQFLQYIKSHLDIPNKITFNFKFNDSSNFEGGDKHNRFIFLNLAYDDYKGDNSSNSDALLLLGFHYYKDKKNYKLDYLKAKYFFQLAAENQNPIALLYLGEIYENGVGVEKNYNVAKKYYEKAAELNNSNGFLNIGKLYYYGKGVDQDYSKARDYFEIAAKQNNSDSYIFLGNLYYYGKGVVKNVPEALKYYQIAEEQKNPKTLFNLGELYYYGIDVEQDFNKAKKYFEQSAEYGNPDAILSLGILYENNKDYSKAKNQYEKIVPDDQQCFKDVIENYRGEKEEEEEEEEYLNGCRICESNTLDYTKLITRKHKSEALLYIGNLYENGYGVEKNVKKAKEYYNMSDQLDNSNAMVKLGNLYLYEKDIDRAKYKFNKALKNNNSYAAFHLGEMSEKNKDIENAIKYYQLSAEQKNAEAYLKLGDMYFSGFVFEKDLKQAKDYYELSSMQNNCNAHLKLGNMYFYGIGTDKNLISAIGYYKLSAKENNPEAFYILGNIESNEFKANKEALNYYEKCTKVPYCQKINLYNPFDNSMSYYFRYNKYTYYSYNNIGLINIVVFNNVDKAIENIREASNGDFSYGRNNCGLLYQFFLKNNERAKELYSRASEQKFALAEYNIGFMNEKSDNIDESINNYIKASNLENEPIVFHGNDYHDLDLEISKQFILCLTNLKLSLYYFSNLDFDNSKVYFVKSFSFLISSQNKLSDMLKYFNQKPSNYYLILKKLIWEYELFNLPHNQSFPNINQENKLENEDFNIKKLLICFNQDTHKIQNELDPSIIAFYKIDDMFDFIIRNDELKNIYKIEIRKIISDMESILYTPPFAILFGRISMEKKQSEKMQNEQSSILNINKNFYDGFES